jgi:hypothetical protein
VELILYVKLICFGGDIRIAYVLDIPIFREE